MKFYNLKKCKSFLPSKSKSKAEYWDFILYLLVLFFFFVCSFVDVTWFLFEFQNKFIVPFIYFFLIIQIVCQTKIISFDCCFLLNHFFIVLNIFCKEVQCWGRCFVFFSKHIYYFMSFYPSWIWHLSAFLFFLHKRLMIVRGFKTWENNIVTSDGLD